MKAIIYMKSGNKIHLHGIKNVEVTCSGNEVTSIAIKWAWYSKIFRFLRLSEMPLMSALDLSAIEAITCR